MTRPALDLGPLAAPVRRSLNGDHPGETGTMLPPLIDHHVHLMIVGVEGLADGNLAGAVDLGSPLDLVSAGRRRDGFPRIDYAGNEAAKRCKFFGLDQTMLSRTQIGERLFRAFFCSA